MFQIPQKIKCTEAQIGENEYVMPVGTYIIIDPYWTEQEEVVMKNGVATIQKEKPRHHKAKVLAVPLSSNRLNPTDVGKDIIYERAMAEAVNVNGKELVFLPENYILAVIRDEDSEVAMVPVDMETMQQLQQRAELDPYSGTGGKPDIVIPRIVSNR